MRRIILLLSVLIFVGTACKIPPFNEEISRVFFLASKMSEEGEVGPVKLGDLSLEQIPLLKFIPLKDSFNEGFLIIDDSEIQIVFITPSGEPVAIEEPMVEEALDFYNGNRKELNYVAETLPMSGPQMTFINISEVMMLPLQRLNVVELDHLKFPPGDDLAIILDGDIPSCIDRVVSADILPGFVTNTLYFLCKETGFPNEFYEIRYDSDAMGLPGPGMDIRPGAGGFPAITFPDAPDSCFYFHYEPIGVEGTSIAQYWIGDRWRTLKWDDTVLPFPPEINVSHRIEALLTTGLLYCVEGETAHLYDLNGILQFSIELGDMKLAYEYWDVDRFKLIFVLPCYVDYGDKTGFVFKVYSIDTEDLEKLAE